MKRLGEDVTNRVNNSVFNLWDKYIEVLNSSLNYKDWQNNKFRPFKLTKRKGDNYYFITDENDNTLCEGTAIDVKRWMKSEMQRYEDEYQEYVRSMTDMREEE